MAALFKLLDNEDSLYDGLSDSYESTEDPTLKILKSYCQDVGISHSTLEEVFMKVTGKKKQKPV